MHECCDGVRSTCVIYYILVSFKFWNKLPKDGVNDNETCSCNTRLHFCLSNVHLLVLRMNNLVTTQGINFQNNNFQYFWMLASRCILNEIYK